MVQQLQVLAATYSLMAAIAIRKVTLLCFIRQLPPKTNSKNLHYLINHSDALKKQQPNHVFVSQSVVEPCPPASPTLTQMQSLNMEVGSSCASGDLSSSSVVQVCFPSAQAAVLSSLNRQREDGRLCDLSIHVQGQVFKAHRCVLAASSPYFHDQVGVLILFFCF